MSRVFWACATACTACLALAVNLSLLQTLTFQFVWPYEAKHEPPGSCTQTWVWPHRHLFWAPGIQQTLEVIEGRNVLASLSCSLSCSPQQQLLLNVFLMTKKMTMSLTNFSKSWHPCLTFKKYLLNKYRFTKKKKWCREGGRKEGKEERREKWNKCLKWTIKGLSVLPNFNFLPSRSSVNVMK